MHLLIPYAHSDDPGCQSALAGLRLPHLARLLGEFQLLYVDRDNADSFAPPHERAHARALTGIDKPPRADDARFPWATWYMLQHHPMADRTGSWAFITPCHWQVQTHDVVMLDPRQLNLTDAESQALMASMQPYFAADGVRLVFDKPGTWLASGDMFRGLETASLDRVIGQSVKWWMPDTDKSKVLRRLQTEMQMLLHRHPVNVAREQAGQLPVNSFWVSGTGRESALVGAPLHAEKLSTYDPTEQTQFVAGSAAHRWFESDSRWHDMPKGLEAVTIHIPQALREAALTHNWPAWSAAWQELDATFCQRLLETSRQIHNPSPSQPLPQLTLCGEQSAITLQARHRNNLRRLKKRLVSRLRPPSIQELLAKL